ncbi:hypothetical protein NHF40_07320 [Maricaulaceae bacterium EIL42A08]|nr:hypothetical protein [Maricaulaceae bacterium EIL42A08]
MTPQQSDTIEAWISEFQAHLPGPAQVALYNLIDAIIASKGKLSPMVQHGIDAYLDALDAPSLKKPPARQYVERSFTTHVQTANFMFFANAKEEVSPEDCAELRRCVIDSIVADVWLDLMR